MRSRVRSWCATEEVEVRPTASPISRMLGGYPRSVTEARMTSRTFRWRSVSPAAMSVPTSIALGVGSAAGLPAATFVAAVLEPVVFEPVVDLVEVWSFMLSASCWCPGSGLRASVCADWS